MTPEQIALAKAAFIAKVEKHGGRTIDGYTILIIGEDSIEEALLAAFAAIQPKPARVWDDVNKMFRHPDERLQ